MSQSIEPSDPRLARFGRWLQGGSIAASHAVAAVVAFTCLVTVPLVLFTLLFMGAILFAAATGGDMGGPLFYPLGAMIIGLIGLVFTLAAGAVGLALDLARRWLRWPIWTTPVFVAGAIGCAVLCASVVWPDRFLGALAAGAVGFAAFATYWIPLALSEAAQKLVLHIGRRTKAWWRKRSAAAGH